METINYGIDLGTTNSGIGRYENGKVVILKNPVGLKETLPSVVSYYRGRILVGDKAREQYLSNSGSVFSAFKRKMGTSDVYQTMNAGQLVEVSPIDLSAYVLKELKNYIQGTDLKAAVITIPASFDTIQSNATKKAGYQAGLSEVILLQEPIAACLAYANSNNLNIESAQKWLVYDFGGGTFDVALVDINHRKLNVIDNKGNNFLGGVDIDHAFIAQIIVPKLIEITGDTNLWAKLTSKLQPYEKLWHYLNYLAEEAKKELSMAASTWMEIDFPELDLFTDFEVKQDELNLVVKPKYLESEKFIKELLTDNSISFSDINRIILVGGTTYIPFIKDSLKALSGISVDDTIDPTTAVIAGASYYAGSQTITEVETTAKAASNALPSLDVKLSFEAYTNDLEELIAFKTIESFSGSYRVVRNDGGFDSGWIAFQNTASEFVSLLPKMKNSFKLSIVDKNQQLVYENNAIYISHGLYSVSGQVLPEDICIELDDSRNTYLHVIFKRNDILPLSKTLYKTFSKSITKGGDDKIIINVVEGKGGTLPGSNLSIGYIEISGQTIDSDLIMGTDIEIQVEMDESRGLKVDIYIPSTLQQITKSFHLANRDVSVEKMLQDIYAAEKSLEREISKSDQKETYEFSGELLVIQLEMEELKKAVKAVLHDQATEEKYRLDERKRIVLRKLDDLTRTRDVYIATKNYKDAKEEYLAQEKYANEFQKKAVQKIFDSEKKFLNSGDKHLIKQYTKELIDIDKAVSTQNHDLYVRAFWYYSSFAAESYRNVAHLDTLINAGKEAIDKQEFERLKPIVNALYNHLDDKHKNTSSKTKSDDDDDSNNIDPNAFKTGLK